MDSILKLFYNQPTNAPKQGPDSEFVKIARIKCAHLDKLNASMTEEQKELLEAYLDADDEINDIIHFRRFKRAFNMGAQLMAEIIQGKEELLD